eukprot:Phypoly_transcript_00100.p1 GENE.Phypoly_transcript_00100~~Phypoly_transcript_00100.p1  ORF type:complete len:1510 (-),score=269.98 Phypoly_transcript_00100:2402-6901(-)
MAPSADTILASLHKDKRTPQLVSEVSLHLKSLQSNHYDIVRFSTQVANEALRDLSTASPDSSLILLQCAFTAISHLETIPDSYLTKTLQPFGLEKLWHRHITKLLEKAQYKEASEHLAHLNERLQAHQAKIVGATTPKSTTKGEKHLTPHTSDTTEFRNAAVGAANLSVQAAYYLSGSLSEPLAALPKWEMWVTHLAEKDALQAQVQTDCMVRLLFSLSKKSASDPRLLSCLEKALDCLVSRRTSFFECANVFSNIYEKQSLLAFHAMVATKIPLLSPPKTNQDSDYVLWAAAYASTLVSASSFNTCATLLQDALANIKNCPLSSDEINQAAVSLLSLWASVNSVHEGNFTTAVSYLKDVTAFLRALPSMSFPSSNTPSQPTLLINKSFPVLYTLTLRTTKAMEELRTFYSTNLCSLRRKTEGENQAAGTPKGTTPSAELLLCLRRVMLGLVEVIDKGNSFDGLLSKAGEKVDNFVSLRVIQVDALHTCAQLHFECEEETAEKLTTYYKRALNISAGMKDKRKAMCISNLVIRTFTMGNVLVQRSQHKAAISLLEAALHVTTLLEGNPSPIPVVSIYSRIASAHASMGDLEAALRNLDAGLKCCLTSNAGASASTSLVPGSPTYGLFEQFIATSSKLDPDQLAPFLASFAHQFTVLEEALKAYQRIAPFSLQHQLAVVDAILSNFEARNYPIRHGRALVEKAKLVRFISNPKLAPDAFIDSAIDLMGSEHLKEDESLSKCVMDETAKAHMWLATFISENQRHFAQGRFKSKWITKALKHVMRGMSLWSTLCDSLSTTPLAYSPDGVRVAHNKDFFIDPTVSVRVMKTMAEFLASIDHIEAQVQLLELALQFAHNLSLPSYEVASVQLALAEVYSGGGYTPQLESYLQRAEALLAQHHVSLPNASQEAQAQQYARVLRHAKLLRLQLSLEKGDIISFETMDDLAEELEALITPSSKKSKEDIVLVAWLKRIRSSVTYTPPQIAMQDAKDAFNLLVQILPDYPPSTPTHAANALQESLSRWQLMRHFLASMENMIQNLEQAGKPQEAHVLYSRALSVALRAGATAHIGRLCLGLGELEYYRHHWTQAKKLLHRAASAFRDCAALSSQTSQQPAQLAASNVLINKHMLALVDMRLGDVYRRLGQLSKAEQHYNAAHNSVAELPKFLAVASRSVPISLQRCADASPREARILGKLERSNKQVQLMSRADIGKSKSKPTASDTSSEDEGSAKRTTTKSRPVKSLPKTKNTRASDSERSSEDEVVAKRTTTKSRQVKSKPKAKNTRANDSSTSADPSSEEERSTTRTTTKSNPKTKKPADSSRSADPSSEDEGTTKRTTPRSRQVKPNPKAKNTRVSDSSSSTNPSNEDEGTITTKRTTTRARPVKLNPRKEVSKTKSRKAHDNESEDEVKPMPAKRGAKTQKLVKNETMQDDDVMEVDSSPKKTGFALICLLTTRAFGRESCPCGNFTRTLCRSGAKTRYCDSKGNYASDARGATITHGNSSHA